MLASADNTDNTDTTCVSRRRLMPFEELYQVCVCVVCGVCGVCVRESAGNGVYVHTHARTHTHTHTHTDGWFSGGVRLGAELAFCRHIVVSVG